MVVTRALIAYDSTQIRAEEVWNFAMSTDKWVASARKVIGRRLLCSSYAVSQKYQAGQTVIGCMHCVEELGYLDGIDD